MKAPRIRKWWSLLVGSVVILSDAASKRVVVRRLGPGSGSHERTLIEGWARLVYARNSGIAFGVLGGHRVISGALGLAAVAFLAAGFLRIRHSSLLLVVGAGLIGGGAAGNLIERLRTGHVTDFISLGRWPTFNLADSAITVGVLMLLWVFGFEDGAGRRMGGSPKAPR